MSIIIYETDVYADWFSGLRDPIGKRAIDARVRRLSIGMPGDAKQIGEELLELRIHCGPGYRIYCTTIETTLVILLAGGDKSTQTSDIAKARRLAAKVKEHDYETN